MAAPPPTDTGKHCALAACRLADFLPLECPHCHHPFCSAHVAPPAHACPSDPHLDQLDPPSSRTGPELRDLVPDPNRHQRPAFQVPSPEATALRAKQLAALDAFKAASRPKGQPPASAAQPATRKSSSPVVELMRLKARAAPLDPRHARRPGDVPLPERVFLHAQLGHDGATVRPLWAAKTISAGKALDLLAEQFKVPNRNNLTTDPAQLLSLARRTDPPTRLDLAQPLASQVESGGTVLLLRGHPWA